MMHTYIFPAPRVCAKPPIYPSFVYHCVTIPGTPIWIPVFSSGMPPPEILFNRDVRAMIEATARKSGNWRMTWN